MIILIILLILLSLFLIFATFITLINWGYWWIRLFDFPRLQIGFLIILSIIASIVIYDFSEWWHYLLIGGLLFSLIYQIRKIYWYTILAPKQVLTYNGRETEDTVSILVSNVFQPNRKSELLIKLINQYKPDLFLVLEADKWWENQLKTIEADYEYKIKKPQDNLYGMILYSKLELSDERVNFIFEDDIPSFEAMVQLNDLDKFKIYCLHPKPPFPTESETSTNRDAELLVVGKKVKKHKLPVIIFGDFNDVAWSNTTRLFQKVSELLDPRIGRGFYNSFHAHYPLFRWSLDHVFHSTHFQLIDLKRLNNIGSDHFPIYIKLHYKPEEKNIHDKPKADEEDLELANEKIETAREEN